MSVDLQAARVEASMIRLQYLKLLSSVIMVGSQDFAAVPGVAHCALRPDA